MSHFVEIFDNELEAIRFALRHIPMFKACPQGGKHNEYDPACSVCDLRQDELINVEERGAVAKFLARKETHGVAGDVGENNSGVQVSLDLAAIAKMYFDTLRLIDRVQLLEAHLEAVKKHVEIGAQHEATLARIANVVNDPEIPSFDGYMDVKDHMRAHAETVAEMTAKLQEQKT